MDKPLGDWTLNEVKEYCRANDTDCTECDFCKGSPVKYICPFHLDEGYPENWDLTPQKTFSQEEIRDARTLLRFWGGMYGTAIIRRNFDGTVQIQYYQKNDAYRTMIYSTLFPSIEPGRVYPVREIAGDYDEAQPVGP